MLGKRGTFQTKKLLLNMTSFLLPRSKLLLARPMKRRKTKDPQINVKKNPKVRSLMRNLSLLRTLSRNSMSLQESQIPKKSPLGNKGMIGE